MLSLNVVICSFVFLIDTSVQFPYMCQRPSCSLFDSSSWVRDCAWVTWQFWCTLLSCSAIGTCKILYEHVLVKSRKNRNKGLSYSVGIGKSIKILVMKSTYGAHDQTCFLQEFLRKRKPILTCFETPSVNLYCWFIKCLIVVSFSAN